MKPNLAIAALAACLGANALAADMTWSSTIKGGAHPPDGITVVADVQRFQAQRGTLQIIEQIAVQISQPRTPMDRHAVEIQLPPGAEIDAAMVQGADGQPAVQTLVPAKAKDRYLFPVPLRPGTMRLQVVYSLPYKGDALIEPKFLYPVERFVVVLPRSMHFAATSAGAFRLVQSKSEDSVRVAAPAMGGHFGFRILGTGILAEVRAEMQEVQRREAARPGGGLGAPADFPDPLHDYRLPILGGVCAALILGGLKVVRKPAAKHARMQPRQQQPRIAT